MKKMLQNKKVRILCESVIRQKVYKRRKNNRTLAFDPMLGKESVRVGSESLHLRSPFWARRERGDTDERWRGERGREGEEEEEV